MDFANSAATVKRITARPLGLSAFKIWMRRGLPTAFLFALLMPVAGSANADPGLQRLVNEREQWLEGARRTGTQDLPQLAKLDASLEQLLAQRSGAERLQVQIELAKVRRQRGEAAQAASLFEATAVAAADAGRSGLAFDAWIGALRAYSDLNDIEATERSYDQAIKAAGRRPTPKQAYDIASYGSEVFDRRGENEAALVASLEATGLAVSGPDRFTAQQETANAFLKLAESCDDRPLVDSLSIDDADRWGACRRAVRAAQNAFAAAERTANGLGWKWLAAQVGALRRNSGLRGQMVDILANKDNQRTADFFDLPRGRKPLVNSNFRANGGSAQEQMVADLARTAVPGKTSDPRQLYIQGQAAEMAGDTATARSRYSEATARLKTERSGYFDARRQGTVTEGRVGVFRDLALLFLQSGQLPLAFDTFESIRSRGLGELVAAMEQRVITHADRDWLRRLTLVEARMSGMQTMIVESTVANGAGALTAPEIAALATLRDERLALLADAGPRAHLSGAPYHQASLANVQQASQRTGIPILLYWVEPSNVIVWVVTPKGSDVKAVFLPQDVLGRLINRVRDTSIERVEGKPFDAAAAQTLYRYLIEPFAATLAAPQLLIIPQGELTALPFEALIDPRDKRFLVQRSAISYAPNATLAVAMLEKPARIDLTVQAVADRTITTPEIANIAAIGAVHGRNGRTMTALDAGAMTLAQLTAAADGAPVLHILAHGKTGKADPLLSELSLGQTLYAADFLGVPLDRTRLVVLSACESGVESRRISNELFGFPWALTIAGADMIVVSRWRADSTSNAEWMKRFYAALGAGASPALAAAQAARAAIAGGDAHPNLWAAMQVIGR